MKNTDSRDCDFFCQETVQIEELIQLSTNWIDVKLFSFSVVSDEINFKIY